MHLTVKILFLLAGLLVSPALGQGTLENAPSGSDHKVKYEYYDVFGSSAAEILTSMKRGAPKEGVFALTTTEFELDHRTIQTDSTCVFADVRATADITVRMPRWTPLGDAPPALVSSWESFVAALAKHEDHHVQLARQTAQEFVQELSSIVEPTCDWLNRIAHQRTMETQFRFKSVNRFYDRDTRHGATQGAIWPK